MPTSARLAALARTLVTASALVAAPLAAQDTLSRSTLPRTLPTQPTRELENIVISALDLQRNTSGGGFRLLPTIAGMTPSHYQVSGYADFRDARWLPWPTTGQPVWNGPYGPTGGCGQSTVRIGANVRVRAFRIATQTYTTSNVASDTLCIPFG